MKIIVGLGNPGKDYEKTRHNTGFLAIDQVAKALGFVFNQTKFKSVVAEGFCKGEKVILLKPQTFMNLSGEAVLSALQFYKCSPENLLILVDDLDLPVGRIRIRPTGSDGGQRGLRSIIQCLNTKDFARIRIGVGNNKLIDTKDYVMGKVNREQQALYEQALEQAAQAAIFFIDGTVMEMMNRFNTHGAVEA